MAELTICTFFWGTKYSLDYVYRLRAGLQRGLAMPHRFVCVADREIEGVETIPLKDPALTQFPGCLPRLRLFDPQWQQEIGGDRFACLDLDLIVTGDCNPAFYRPETFMILQGANAMNPCPYNGSVWMLRAGHRPDVWSEFSLEALRRIPFFEFPDDQAWFAHKMPNAPGWKVGAPSGIYAFEKPGWPKGTQDLPKDARMVVFPGWRDPAKFAHLPWVQDHWVQ